MGLASFRDDMRPDKPRMEMEEPMPQGMMAQDMAEEQIDLPPEPYEGDPKDLVLTEKIKEIIDTDNIATIIEPTKLNDMSSQLLDGINKDKESMSDYLDAYKNALSLAKMKKDSGDKTFPFVGASKVMMPYVADIALEFSSRFTPDLLGKKEICQAEITGTDSEFKEDVADRVTTAINYDLTCGIKNWINLQDLAMYHLPITGMIFKKNWQCPIENKRKTALLFADQMIYNHNSDSFYDAPRHSFEFELSKNEVVSMMRREQYLPIDVTGRNQNGDSFKFIECHCYFDLDEDDFAEPYIVTIYEPEQKIVSIVKRFTADDIEINEIGEIIEIDCEKFFSQLGFIPDPEKPAVYLGFGILLADIFESINTNTRQMIDSGTLQITGGNSGFIRRGAKVGERGGNRMRKGAVELVMGQFTQIETSGTNPLKDDIINFPFQGLSEGLFRLVEALKAEVRTMAQASMQVEANNQEAAAMYLAKLQQGLKKPNAIMLRIYEGLKSEFCRVYELQKKYLTDEEYIEILGVEPKLDQREVMAYAQAMQMWQQAQQQGIQAPPPEEPVAKMEPISKERDYSNKYIFKPVANPALGSEQERISRSLAISQRAQQMPNIYDIRKAELKLLEAMGEPNPEELIPEPDPNAVDPMAQLQMQYLELEKRKAEIKAQEVSIAARESQAKIKKLFAEVDKVISETAKNYSEIDAARSNELLNVWGRMQTGIEEMPSMEIEEENDPLQIRAMTNQNGTANG